MFEIKYKIVDDMERLHNITVEKFDEDGSDIEGYFLLNFDGHFVGYFSEESLVLLCELELITFWFKIMFDTIDLLDAHKYVVVPIFETCDQYIEFKQRDQLIKVSLVEYPHEGVDRPFYFTTPKKDFRYKEWKNVMIDRKEFVFEILNKARCYLNEIKSINSNLLRTKRFSLLNERLNLLQTKHKFV